MPRPRECPVCQSRMRELIYRQNFLDIEQTVYRCSDCSMIYSQSPNVDYANDSIYTNPSLFENGHCARYHQTALSLMNHVPFHARILDIGCTTGGQMHYLQQAGYEN